MIANDGILVSQSKSAEYYQSSFVILRQEIDFRKSRLYVFNQVVSQVKIAFLIPINYLGFKKVRTLQIQIIHKLQTFLHQNINSFVRQSVFLNETITSNNLYKSLYSA